MYNRKTHDSLAKLRDSVFGKLDERANFFGSMHSCLSALPSIRYAVVIPFVPHHSMDLHEIPNRFERLSSIVCRRIQFSLTIDAFLSMASEPLPPLEFEQVPFDHPLFIISALICSLHVSRCVLFSFSVVFTCTHRELRGHRNVSFTDMVEPYWITWKNIDCTAIWKREIFCSISPVREECLGEKSDSLLLF